jgi:hypothetical protein
MLPVPKSALKIAVLLKDYTQFGRRATLTKVLITKPLLHTNPYTAKVSNSFEIF